MNLNDVKLGDELIYESGGFSVYKDIVKIAKITPSQVGYKLNEINGKPNYSMFWKKNGSGVGNNSTIRIPMDKKIKELRREFKIKNLARKISDFKIIDISKITDGNIVAMETFLNHFGVK